MKKCFVLAFLVALAACQSRFLEGQPTLTVINNPGDYQYGSPVWLSNELIVLLGKRIDAVRTSPTFFLSYNLDLKKWIAIPVSTDSNCQLSGASFPEKLSNHNIGFVDTCITGGNEIRTIREINISTGEIGLLLNPGIGGVPGKFSFSSDMTELVQEDMTGRFLSNKLFYLKNDEVFQILPDFTRAMYPDWSPLGRQIAFWGTENYSGGDPEEFTTLSEILGLSSYSWDLFISTPEGMDVVKVFSDVDDVLLLAWSPNAEKIAFSGTIDGNSGVFVLDLNTSNVTRIWSKLGDFDWSPDGAKILILDTEKDSNGNIKNQSINILDIQN
jgi:hypothetical protein